VPHDKWLRLAGLDLPATKLCAEATTMMLVSHAKQCGVFIGQRASRRAIAQAYAAYGSGGNCTPNKEMNDRAAQWETLLIKYGPRPDIPGFRRVPLDGVPPPVKKQAEEMLAVLNSAERPANTKVGDTINYSFDNVPGRWKLRVERHAAGKIGISVFEEVSKK
jgi:hypothetical protein